MPDGRVEPRSESASRTRAFRELTKALEIPHAPVPTASLNLLHETAKSHTGGAQAARTFLYWLTGQPDPTGHQGSGGLELRRMDREHRAAAIEVLSWWAGPTKSDDPLYGILRDLTCRFRIAEKPHNSGS